MSLLDRHSTEASRPSASSESVRRRMSRTPHRDTPPELDLRSRLHRAGLRFRVDYCPLEDRRRRADIVFTRAELAIFVDGCFWHGCPEHGTWPKANAEFWRAKIETNRRRDADTTQRLEAAGWRVLRYWEHADMQKAAEEVRREVCARLAALGSSPSVHLSH